jgi:uncharacterized membrane-anchored protein
MTICDVIFGVLGIFDVYLLYNSIYNASRRKSLWRRGRDIVFAFLLLVIVVWYFVKK